MKRSFKETDETSSKRYKQSNYVSYPSLSVYSTILQSKHFNWKVEDFSKSSSAVVWFKFDLRVLDNPALYFAAKYAKESTGNCLIALYVFCLEEFKIHEYADCKILLTVDAIKQLQTELRIKYNIPLVVLIEEKATDIPLSVKEFCHNVKCKKLFYNKQYEIDEARRDKLVEKLLFENHKISVESFHDQCVVPPGTCKTQQGNDYFVFTPYKNRWLSLLENEADNYLTLNDVDDLKFKCLDLDIKIISDKNLDTEVSSLSQTIYEKYWKLDKNNHPKDIADKYISEKVSKYDETRDFPSLNGGTSRLSPYLAIGMISVKYLVLKCKALNKNKLSSGIKGIVVWVSELCWRDFYRNITSVYPSVVMNKPFKKDTTKIPWNTDKEAFTKWCEGKTGFPIVDAGMRQLNSTGWMHNRVRMITAMFLTKDLLINWQWGESYFMKNLIDGDFASNNGGWQWSASTGTDSQPYFRVFNPVLQSQKFDASGEYIRKWVPELSSIKSKTAIHDPSGTLSKLEFAKLSYPSPIVDHAKARIKTVEVFKQIMKK